MSARDPQPKEARWLAARRLVTCDPTRATQTDPLGVLEDAFVRIEDGRIAALGHQAELSEADRASLPPAHPLITPGLVDAHTHAAWMGSRHVEYAMRMAGADYEDIARAGGGIVSTMRAVREATLEAIEESLTARLRRMASLGVTTVEVKSGYGLDLESERKQLLAIHSRKSDPRMPRVVATYLALHALPPAEKDVAGAAADPAARREAYARHVAEHDFERLTSGDAPARFDFVDAYIERSAFSVAQARPILTRAREKGFGLRLHVGQFADVGGAELAAELGASTVDHAEHIGPAGIQALAAAGVRAVLLPVASFTLAQQPPDVAALRAAGVRLVVASDANPGTAPTESLPLAMALAARTYALQPHEIILGATREAAASLNLEAGVLRPGAPADLAAWHLPHELALLQPFASPTTALVLRDGREIG